MPGLAQRNDQFSNGSSQMYSLSSPNSFWSKHRDDVSCNQLQKCVLVRFQHVWLLVSDHIVICFWNELSPQDRQELLRIDKQTLFEQARKNMYCSRCNGLLLEGFLQIVMYGKSLQQEGANGHLPSNRSGASTNQNDGESMIINQEEIQDPSVHPWGGLITTKDNSLTLMDCYLYSKSLKGLQNVFDSARARERERELLYPDACGGGGRGWISQGLVGYGRGHGTRETCALHTARLSCDTLVDFWSALGEETRQSLLRMKEEDFIERLMYSMTASYPLVHYSIELLLFVLFVGKSAVFDDSVFLRIWVTCNRFDSKRFCRDCRRNVIREFKELKELKRMRKEPRCTSWFCVADTAFQYEVSDDTVQADWRHTFADTVGTYHHFEWAVGTGEGKCDILEFENVGMNGSVKVDGLDLGGVSACFITLRAWKLDGRCTELSVKAHALKGGQCVHCRLVVGDGFVTITRGESIRRFFEHAEEAEEEEDDDSMDKDGNELDGECSRPQKHAKSPELAREFLLDAATVIFKEQVEKAFREGTARQNAHSIFVCLALKLLEERVHVACKEIITLEKQMKLLEEEEKEKREEEERKERRRTKEREKKLRRKERLKGKEKDKDKSFSELNLSSDHPDVPKEDSLLVDEEAHNSVSCSNSIGEACDNVPSRPGSPDIQDELFSNDYHDEDLNLKDEYGSFTVEQSKFSYRRSKFWKEGQTDQSLKWSDRRRFAVVQENAPVPNRSDSRCYGDNLETPRAINLSNRQLRANGTKPISRHCGTKFSEKFHCSGNGRTVERYDYHSCSCNQNTEYRAKVEPHVSASKVGRETKSGSKSESTLDMSKQFYRGSKYNQIDHTRDSCGRPKSKFSSVNNPSSRDLLHSKKVWEPLESQKKYVRSNSDSDVTLKSSALKTEGSEPNNSLIRSSGVVTCSAEFSINSCKIDEEGNDSKESTNSTADSYTGCQDEKQDFDNTKEVSREEIRLSQDHSALNSYNPTTHRTADPVANISSSSDNCSLCLSEGDSNTASSSTGNHDSSSTSDSEDSSQQSEGKETSISIQNDVSNGHVVRMETNQKADGGDQLGARTYVNSQTGTGNNIFGTPPKIAHAFDNGLSTVSMASQHQNVVSPMHNQNNIHFPVFQAPSTVGYYHQNPVSWPVAPNNGIMPFSHPNHYMYAGPLGYSMNGNSRFCMQYSPVQHLPTPLFAPGPVPFYQPIAKANVINSEEPTQISKPHAVQEASNASTEDCTSSVGAHATHALSGEICQSDDSGKLHTIDNSFSLFHFGGPVALSTGCNSIPVPSKEEIVGDFSSKAPTDNGENNPACNKNKTTVEEYNLFAASNGIRFSFF
ncbi:hypothetical protein F8388_013327 [Cannabis sativa]|uniref:Uncharacterized protein n=1 Tax=Cannabis sativa TaxID=3483 RepID=A0A7J6FEE4_CANSA|nr:hypothetical protein F8388_013327 [Cannabis sativa]KAF4402441.1 hypothetical protein G4B88_012226 [Cannabis sativa]